MSKLRPHPSDSPGFHPDLCFSELPFPPPSSIAGRAKKKKKKAMGSDDSPEPPSPAADIEQPPSAWSSSFLSRSSPTTPRSRPSSPRASAIPFPSPSYRTTRFSPSLSLRRSLRGGAALRELASAAASLWRIARRAAEDRRMRTGPWSRRRRAAGGLIRRRTRGLAAWGTVVAFFFLVNWWMFSKLQDPPVRIKGRVSSNGTLSPPSPPAIKSEGEWSSYVRGNRLHKLLYTRLLALAAHALAEAENRPEPRGLWQELIIPAASWTPCAEKRSWETCEGTSGYILVSANGGINQQRVAICNAVVIARLLNATLVIPTFFYSSVWRDKSQFSDIYQEEHFISYLKPDIRIVKELPLELRSLDLEAIGSVVNDTKIMKEAKPSFYVKKILPILLKNRVVHLIGFGNRLAFDPIPFDLQRLRCRCNFHALRFVNKIQETGALLVKRMRQNKSYWGPLEQNLLGQFTAKSSTDKNQNLPTKVPRYLAVHLRFEVDMAAYSMCYFGGGKDEEEELEEYRALHFPALTQLRKTMKIPSAASLRSEGRCPLTPEEAVLMLAALGFNRKTSIYVAGANIYGGKSRMAAFRNLYPNLATKESLLTPSEIEPFRNCSSQLAALDFIVCAVADAFAMTDTGSQFSSLVSGYRMYYGGGRFPSIRPNKRRLASIFSKNLTIEWNVFEERVRKANKESKAVQERPIARSVYRHPRCPECMCKMD